MLPSVDHGPGTELGRNPVKLVRLVKKALPKKSLKSYAWYGWI
ncbi:tryptorubin family RiPP precursor [Amycolatopsis lexingtonensis]